METTTWRCDTCHGEIESIEDALVEWYASEIKGVTKTDGYRIVHTAGTSPKGSNLGCQYDKKENLTSELTRLEDTNISHFRGDKGLLRMLNTLSANENPPKSLIELIKRIHVPEYEQKNQQYRDDVGSGYLTP